MIREQYNVPDTAPAFLDDRQPAEEGLATAQQQDEVQTREQSPDSREVGAYRVCCTYASNDALVRLAKAASGAINFSRCFAETLCLQQ